MLHPEQLQQVTESSYRLSRRSFLRGLAGLAVMAVVPAALSRPTTVRAEEWLALPAQPFQDPEWFPLSTDVARAQGKHTLYAQGGPLDTYDSFSTLIGAQTNFRGQNEQFVQEYFTRYSFLNRVLLETSGYCHGVANASAYGEVKPVGDDNVSRLNKLGLLAAFHSGDSMYRPGINQLIEDMIIIGRPFVIETKGPEGFWSRVVYGVNSSRTMVLATDFGRGAKEISINYVQNAYFPVPIGEEQNYPTGTVTPVPPEWRIPLDKRLVRYLLYGDPLN